ncbi:MAG: UDP-N-acetylmuramoyl-L-alanyl-D-glutamate--2,6-diaminopimelate ligase [Deltaproteobacteria bacterium]|nr:UDP-N-acetylmuramoyl-L-alanyl-D-glutamate--2,6-diaminopimelate ligase [Deltaproteobacteria bacterium]
MRLAELCKDQPVRLVRGGEEIIDRLTLDSREAVPGAMFAALVDPVRDGEAFVADALARGASAVLAARELETGGAAMVVADAPREVFGVLAHRLAGDPAKAMTLVGVTGTNGKTSFVYLLESMLAEAGERVGVVGTVTHRYAGREIPARNTTPEAPELAALFADMRRSGVTFVVMEVSSHGLALSRVAGCAFRAGVFTNLSRDHLDFHGSEDEYLAAKALLFSRYLDARAPGAVAVLNADEPSFDTLAAQSAARVASYGRAERADYRITEAQADARGTRFHLAGPKETVALESPLLGDFQLQNIAAAAVTALELGVPADAVRRGVANLARVPGRMDKVESGDVLVLVDYAHGPEALRNVVEASRRLATGRLITVFGCGGDRDRGKRPMMAKAAASQSDVVVVTSDNPRTEDPAKIIEEILTGLPESSVVFVEEDRRAAIEYAVAATRPGDVVLIAGKGHEDYQIRGRTKIHFDDREEAARALARRAATAAAETAER